MLLELESLLRLVAPDFLAGRLHPFLLLVGKAGPDLVADEDHRIVGLVLGHRHDRRDFVMLVYQEHREAVLRHIDDAGLERGINLAEGHMHDLRTVCGEQPILGRRRLHADLDVLDVLDLVDLFLAVEIAQALRRQRQHMRAFDLAGEHLAHRRRHAGIAERLDGVILVAEDEMDREHAGLRLDRRRIGRRDQDEIDVAGLDLLQGLRLLAELGAGILIDLECALAQLRELLREEIGGNAVGARLRLIVGE